MEFENLRRLHRELTDNILFLENKLRNTSTLYVKDDNCEGVKLLQDLCEQWNKVCVSYFYFLSLAYNLYKLILKCSQTPGPLGIIFPIYLVLWLKQVYIQGVKKLPVQTLGRVWVGKSEQSL